MQSPVDAEAHHFSVTMAPAAFYPAQDFRTREIRVTLQKWTSFGKSARRKGAAF